MVSILYLVLFLGIILTIINIMAIVVIGILYYYNNIAVANKIDKIFYSISLLIYFLLLICILAIQFILANNNF